MKMKKLLALLLCLVLLVSLLPAGARAAASCTVGLYIDPTTEAGTLAVNPNSDWHVEIRSL